MMQYGTPGYTNDVLNAASAVAAYETVPVAWSEGLAAVLAAAGTPCELYTYPGDNHTIGNNFGVAMERSVTFFDQYSKGGVKGDPNELIVAFPGFVQTSFNTTQRKPTEMCNIAGRLPFND